MKTLSEAIESLVCRGCFTAHFGVRGDQLRGFESGKTFGTNDVTIREYERFEGCRIHDMAILLCHREFERNSWDARRRLWRLLESPDQRIPETCSICRQDA